MSLNKEIKQETSIPLSARVSIMTLAELDMTWQRNEQVPRSMSQLVSWSLELLREILKAKGQLAIEFGVAEAHSYLQTRGLYQGLTKKRGMKKIVTAMGFEALRAEGKNPKSCAPLQHGVVHNKGSVEPVPQVTRLAELDRVIKKSQGEGVREDTPEEIADREKRIDEMLSHASREEGLREGMSECELDEHDKKREEERIALENQEPDLSKMTFADE